MQQIKLYDVGHFSHTVYTGFYWQGETVVNCDNYSKPVKKDGQAPCALLDLYPFWFTMEKAEQDLTNLGFAKIDSITWQKEIEKQRYENI